MSGKTFVWLLTAFLLTTAFLAGDAAAKKMPRVGYLFCYYVLRRTKTSLKAIREGLRELGYVEGRDHRPGGSVGPKGGTNDFPALVAELVHLKVDILVVATTPGASGRLRARQATIPAGAWWPSRDPVGRWTGCEPCPTRREFDGAEPP